MVVANSAVKVAALEVDGVKVAKALREGNNESAVEGVDELEGAGVAAAPTDALSEIDGEPVSIIEGDAEGETDHATHEDGDTVAVREACVDSVALGVADAKLLPEKGGLSRAVADGNPLPLAGNDARGDAEALALSLLGAEAAADVDGQFENEGGGVACALCEREAPSEVQDVDVGETLLLPDLPDEDVAAALLEGVTVDATVVVAVTLCEGATVELRAAVIEAQGDADAEARPVALAATDNEAEAVIEGVSVGFEEGGAEKLAQLLCSGERDTSGEAVGPALAEADSVVAADGDVISDGVEVVEGADGDGAPEGVGTGLSVILAVPQALPLTRADSAPEADAAPRDGEGGTDSVEEPEEEVVVAAVDDKMPVAHTEGEGISDGVTGALVLPEKVGRLVGVSRPLADTVNVGAPLTVAPPDPVAHELATLEGGAETVGAAEPLPAGDDV